MVVCGWLICVGEGVLAIFVRCWPLLVWVFGLFTLFVLAGCLLDLCFVWFCSCLFAVDFSSGLVGAWAMCLVGSGLLICLGLWLCGFGFWLGLRFQLCLILVFGCGLSAYLCDLVVWMVL